MVREGVVACKMEGVIREGVVARNRRSSGSEEGRGSPRQQRAESPSLPVHHIPVLVCCHRLRVQHTTQALVATVSDVTSCEHNANPASDQFVELTRYDHSNT